MKIKWIIRGMICIIVSIELGIIIFSAHEYYKNKKVNTNVLGAVTIVPIRKEFLISSPSAELKYFYEPPPSEIQVDEQEWLPYTPAYTINNDTLNERYDYPIAKSQDVYRILTLGDSFTFGHYVNTKDNWTELLEDKLNEVCTNDTTKKIEVINLGERGYDVKYAAHRLLTRGMKYNPDLILYFESISGFDRIRELYDPLTEYWEKHLSETDASASAQEIVSQAWRNASDDVKRSHSEFQLFGEIHQAWTELFSTRGDTPVIIATFNNINFRDMARLKLWTMGYVNVSLLLGVRDISESDGVLPDGHPSTVGHKLIADDIYTYLTGHQIIRCQ